MWTEAEIIWRNLMRNGFIVKLSALFKTVTGVFSQIIDNTEISLGSGSLTQASRAEAVVSPGRWFGLVAVQNLLHELLCWEASAAIPIAASPLDAMNCRERGDTDVSQTATQTSTSPAPPTDTAGERRPNCPTTVPHHGPNPSSLFLQKCSALKHLRRDFDYYR